MAGSDDPHAGRMQWRLYEMMAKRGIRTATDLQRRLAAIGVHVTSTHLARLVSGEPLRMSRDIMWGLTEVLECDTNDLWRNPRHDRRRGTERPDSTASAYPRAADERDASAVGTPNDEDELANEIGPKLSTFPKGKN